MMMFYYGARSVGSYRRSAKPTLAMRTGGPERRRSIHKGDYTVKPGYFGTLGSSVGFRYIEVSDITSSEITRFYCIGTIRPS
jgi:hypothetical protein